jgi:hypothetical protein
VIYFVFFDNNNRVLLVLCIIFCGIILYSILSNEHLMMASMTARAVGECLYSYKMCLHSFNLILMLLHKMPKIPNSLIPQLYKKSLLDGLTPVLLVAPNLLRKHDLICTSLYLNLGTAQSTHKNHTKRNSCHTW